MRSAADGQVFDLLPEVASRYSGKQLGTPPVMWKFNRQPRVMKPGQTLRIITGAPFQLRWTLDEWQTTKDTPSKATGFGPHFVDIPVPTGQKAPVRFTFVWTDSQKWEGHDFSVTMG